MSAKSTNPHYLADLQLRIPGYKLLAIAWHFCDERDASTADLSDVTPDGVVLAIRTGDTIAHRLVRFRRGVSSYVNAPQVINGVDTLYAESMWIRNWVTTPPFVITTILIGIIALFRFARVPVLHPLLASFGVTPWWINFFFVFMCCGHVAEAILVWRLGARLRLRRPGRWGLATLFFGMPATMLFTSLYLAQRRG